MWTMPHDGVSTDWIQERENDIARITAAKDEHLDRIRDLADILRRRRFITERYCRDLRDSLDFIACALLIGKRNTARLRRRPPH
jgi:hypothetical protein